MFVCYSNTQLGIENIILEVIRVLLRNIASFRDDSVSNNNFLVIIL